MGKSQSIQIDDRTRIYRISPTGHLVETSIDDHDNVSWWDHGGGWAPNADVTVARRVSGPDDNAYFNWHTVAADRGDGWGDQVMRWWGDASVFGSKADHWEGPFSP